MTPQARVQAAIEVLDLVIAAARANAAPADRILSDWFKPRRFAGSGDRRAVRELVYAAIRSCGDIPDSGRAAMLLLARQDSSLAALFDGSRHAPQPIRPQETAAQAGIAPHWLVEALAKSGIAGDAAAALLERAPLDIRVNALKGDRSAISLPLDGEELPAPQGIRLPHGTPVERWDAWLHGQIEVQDCGSQLACMAVEAAPGELIVDLCAGAGGKTLALAGDMANRGRLIASDSDRSRLARLAPRAERSGASIVETRLLNPGAEAAALGDLVGKADAVLVDAPCSGSGTWRRNPEARWRLSPSALERVTALQARLLDLAATLVRPGGRLVFVTCSLLDAEGADQAASFLHRNPDWKSVAPGLPAGSARGDGVRLSPADDSCDGFFIARFKSLC